MEKPKFTSVIAIPGFRYLWLNQLLLQLALNTLNFALVLWVYRLTGSSLAVSALILCVYLPALFFTIIAGVVADLLDKKKIIMVVDVLIALSLALFVLIKGSYPAVLANTFFINSLFQFFMPAEGSAIPMLVSKRQLFVANSLFSLTLYASFIVGFALAGPVLEHLGINVAFLLGSLELVAGFFLVRSLPKLKAKKITDVSQQFLSRLSCQKKLVCLDTVRASLSLVAAETRQTLLLIKGKLNVAVAIGLLSGVHGIIGLLAVVIPSYLESVLKIHATDASYFLMVPLGLGTILGALILGRFAHNFPRRLVVIPAIISAGMIFLGVGSAPALAGFVNSSDLLENMSKLRYILQVPTLSSVFAAGAFLIGLSAVSILIPAQTVIQENISGYMRGKVSSVLVLMMNCFGAVVSLLAGVLSDLFGATRVFIWLGVVIAAFGIVALRPALFFKQNHLPAGWRRFLGLGHWVR